MKTLRLATFFYLHVVQSYYINTQLQYLSNESPSSINIARKPCLTLPNFQRCNTILHGTQNSFDNFKMNGIRSISILSALYLIHDKYISPLTRNSKTIIFTDIFLSLVPILFYKFKLYSKIPVLDQYIYKKTHHYSKIYQLPWRRSQQSSINKLYTIILLLIWFLFHGLFLSPITLLCNILEIQYDCSEQLISVWIIPSILILSFVPDFFNIPLLNNIRTTIQQLPLNVSKLWQLIHSKYRNNKSENKYDSDYDNNKIKDNIDKSLSLSSSSSSSSTTIMRYGLKLPKGSYKPLSVYGSDWMTCHLYNIENTDDSYDINIDYDSNSNSDDDQKIQTKVSTLNITPLPSLWILSGYLISIGGIRILDFCQSTLLPYISNLISYGNNQHIIIETMNQPNVIHEVISSLPQDNNALTLLIGTIAPCLLGPIWEEILYRGYILPCLASIWNIRISIVVSSLLFALQHGDIASLLPLFFLSTLWSNIYLQTKNIFIPIIIHILWNLRPFVATMFTLI